MALEFKFINECNPLDLIRVKLNDEAFFAIIGKAPDRSQQGMLVLDSKKAPAIVNFMVDGHITGDFETYKVLVYGTDWKITPDHAGICQVAEGTLFKRTGACVLANHFQYIVADIHPQMNKYFNLNSADTSGQPGGGRAAFAGWKLTVLGFDEPLIKFAIA
jgi:hypothetical protein